MPKIIELTVEIQVQRVSCPGVWLCQGGKVSFTIYTLGTTYQTCLLPPVFPLMFKDVFYFKKRFQESCLANNICCLLRNEYIYCELIQWSDDCLTDKCVKLAQYLGNLNDVLFPPNTCSSDGVDLLMRRTKDFPGILSPKIEIATKCRIDEIWHPKGAQMANVEVFACSCYSDDNRQKQVCHSPMYHKNKCAVLSDWNRRSHSATRSCDKSPKGNNVQVKNANLSGPRCGKRMDRGCNIVIKDIPQYEPRVPHVESSHTMCGDREFFPDVSRYNKTLLDSQHIDTDRSASPTCKRKQSPYKVEPCICEICKKYHDLFHK